MKLTLALSTKARAGPPVERFCCSAGALVLCVPTRLGRRSSRGVKSGPILVSPLLTDGDGTQGGGGGKRQQHLRSTKFSAV